MEVVKNMKTAIKYFFYGAAFVIVVLAAMIVYANYQKKIQTPPKPPLPILVQYRRAVLNPSLVADFSNQSNRDLLILATFENPTLNEMKKWEISLAPNATREIGHLEGWAFHSGDKITLHHADYADEKITLP
jgi:hypothetical protein